MKSRFGVLSLLALALAMAGGCNRARPLQTGYLSDYSRLEEAGGGNLRFVSDRLPEYDAYIVQPVEVLARREKPVLSDEQRREVARYFDEQLVEMLIARGFVMTTRKGEGVARVRIAVTDVRKPTWFLNLHPGSKLTGAGVGSAAVEAEVVDSVSGEQLAAFVDARSGNQFEIDTFSTLDDVKDVIRSWVLEAGARLDALMAERDLARTGP